MYGSCECKNIEVQWKTIDYSSVPRACQCDYCRAKSAAYVSKSASAVDVVIHNPGLHRIVTHGTGTAQFHECGYCGTLVFVSCEIDGIIYGVLNAACLDNKFGFAKPVAMDFSNQPVAERLLRRQQNWCYPVNIRFQ